MTEEKLTLGQRIVQTILNHEGEGSEERTFDAFVFAIGGLAHDIRYKIVVRLVEQLATERKVAEATWYARSTEAED